MNNEPIQHEEGQKGKSSTLIEKIQQLGSNECAPNVEGF